MIRVLVCGGRNYRDRDAVFSALDRVDADRRISEVIQGGAAGADYLGNEWAADRKRIRSTFRAQWAEHGKAAGPLRNQRMIDVGKPDLVVAFPGGSGTADMVRRAEAAGVKVLRVERRHD